MTGRGEPPEAAAVRLADEIAQLMMRLSVITEPVMEAVNGYRAQLVAQGYAPELAARMAADYHGWVLDTLRNARGGGGRRGDDGDEPGAG